ncbi:MAG: HD domain-containing protein [Acidimicrobiia bacterium]
MQQLTVTTAFVWVPYIFFSILFLISVLREVIVTVGDTDIGMSSDTAIAGGAAVIFYTSHSPLSLILAMAITVIYPRNIKKRKWAVLAFNVSNEIVAVCATYFALRILDFSINEPVFIVIFKVFIATSVFELINYSILAIDSAFRGENWRELLYDLRKSLIEVLPLALFSGLLGKFYFDYGTPMLLLFVVPLFFGRELAASYARMSETQKSTLDTLTRTLEAKDKYTAGHVERVAKFAKYIGEELGYGPRRLERLRQAALLHDAGKLVVPSALLNKPGKLTEEEFKIIQRHEFVTIETLKSIDFLSSIAYTAGGDHNTMEGKDTRKLEPFIVSACDAFDAMTSSRSYRKALPMEVAFEELQSKKGKQFHPKVVEALIKAIESRDEHYGAGYETDIIHDDAPEVGIGSAGIGDLEAQAVKEDLESQSKPIPSIKRVTVDGQAPAIADAPQAGEA